MFPEKKKVFIQILQVHGAREYSRAAWPDPTGCCRGWPSVHGGPGYGSPTGQDSLAITFHSDRCDDFDRASPVFPLNSFRLQGI